MCVGVCVCVCACVCVYVDMYVYIYVCISTHITHPPRQRVETDEVYAHTSVLEHY